MSKSFDLGRVPRKDESVLIRKVKDEAYLIKRNGQSMKEEKLWILNSLAFLIWENIDGKRTCSDIVIRLTEQFDAEPERIKEDFINLLLELKDQGLVILQTNNAE